MGKFNESKIEEIPADETVLKEGLLQTMNIFAVGNTKYTKYTFKYAFTDKGIWTKGKSFLFIKGRVGFLPYSDIKSYQESTFGRAICYIFNPANGKKAANRIFFDNKDEVVPILDKFIARVEKDK